MLCRCRFHVRLLDAEFAGGNSGPNSLISLYESHTANQLKATTTSIFYGAKLWMDVAILPVKILRGYSFLWRWRFVNQARRGALMGHKQISNRVFPRRALIPKKQHRRTVPPLSPLDPTHELAISPRMDQQPRSYLR
jgi:hypothetical protein